MNVFSELDYACTSQPNFWISCYVVPYIAIMGGCGDYEKYSSQFFLDILLMSQPNLLGFEQGNDFKKQENDYYFQMYMVPDKYGIKSGETFGFTF